MRTLKQNIPILISALIYFLYILIENNILKFLRNEVTFNLFISFLLPAAAILLIVQICFWGKMAFEKLPNNKKGS